jgi:hypothetical protein
MTIYINEALRRLSAASNCYYWDGHPAIQAFAEALQELGWKPPVDPLLLRAREIVARIQEGKGWADAHRQTLKGVYDDSVSVLATLAALKENSNA